jgi:hypothetical protein
MNSVQVFVPETLGLRFIGMVSVWNRLHSKSPCGLGHGILVDRSNVPETPGDRASAH